MWLRVAVAALCGLILCGAGMASFEGRYAASRGHGFRQSAVITRKDGAYKVLLTVKSRLCTGELEAYGEVKAGKLVAETDSKDDPCRVSITRHGAGIEISEQKCLNWHGAACDFNGKLKRR